MAEFKLPDVGEGLTEAEIVTWKVKEGDTVVINEILVEIETAKSLVELPSPFAGVVQKLMVSEGETVPVGTPIIAIGDSASPSAEPVEPVEAAQQTESDPYLGMAQKAGAAETAPPEIDLSNPAASGGGEGESLVGRNKADRSAVRRARHAAVPSSAGAAATQQQLQGSFEPGFASPEVLDVPDEPAVPATSAPVSSAADRTLAKPPVRKLAKDLGVDLSSLAGTGPNGAVTREDVETAVSSVQPVEGHDVARPAMTGRRETREPIKGVRKMMGQAMVGSAFSIPHVTEWVTLDVTRTMEFVDRLKGRREFRDVKVSPLLVLARAVMLAMRRTPEINSWWDDGAQEVVYKSYVNLGIAAATPRGLVVPNVKDAEQLSLHDLAAAFNALTATAREGKTQPAEMTGGTFTITNVGVFGIDSGTPIINPGESAILAFGAIKKQPWVVNDEIVVRQVTTLALSFDHRHIDGEKGSRFLADVAGILEDPASALLF
jgi:2-oxoisovalerate dehydrogenase E2 component (dihydrolipoyl transacylase)